MSSKTKTAERRGLLSERTRSFLDNYVFNYHDRIHRDNLAKMVNHLEGDHPVKMLLGEQRKINYTLSLLEKARDKFQKCSKFECVTVEQWRFLDAAVSNFKKFDQLFHEEEALLFPELVEHGFGGEIRQIMAEHHQIHELIAKMVSAYESGLRDNFGSTISSLDTISESLAKKIRLLIHHERYILYPRALRVISGQNAWQRLREIAGKLHVQLTDAS